MTLKKNFLFATLLLSTIVFMSCSTDADDKLEDLVEQQSEDEMDEVEDEAEVEEEIDEVEEVEEVEEEENEEEEDQLSFEVFEDIIFDVDTDGLDSKRFFSTKTGTLYSYNEIDAEIGPTIDLAWYDMSPSNSGFLFWDSPDSIFQGDEIPGATSTKMENTADQMTVEEFDLITEASQLNMLIIDHENEAMGPIDYPVIVLFENAAGHIGAIKMKSNDGEFMTVDIKISR